MVETKRELRVKKGISGESTKKAAIPFRIAAYIYGAEGRTRKVSANLLKSLDSRCRWLHVFCRILQPIRNHFPWVAR